MRRCHVAFLYPSFSPLPFGHLTFSLFSFFLLHVHYFTSSSPCVFLQRVTKEKKNIYISNLLQASSLGHHHHHHLSRHLHFLLQPSFSLFSARHQPSRALHRARATERRSETAVDHRDVGARGDHREEDEEAVGEWYFADSVRNFISLV